MTKIAILQSNYIPWKGYFHLIDSVDIFVFLDEVQYTRRDWRNRNKIVTAKGTQWLTIPVNTKGKYHQKVCETLISDDQWRFSHLKQLAQHYGKAAHFNEVYPIIESWYKEIPSDNLSVVNKFLCKQVCNFLKIKTKILCSSDFELSTDPSQRLAMICEQSGSNLYVSGPAAKTYLNIEEFRKHNIAVEWFDYGISREYVQLNSRFEPNVSILDLLLNCGLNSSDFFRGRIELR